MVKAEELQLALTAIKSEPGLLPSITDQEKRILDGWMAKGWWAGASIGNGWLTDKGRRALIQLMAMWSHDLPKKSGLYHVAERLWDIRVSFEYGEERAQRTYLHKNVPVHVDKDSTIRFVVGRPWKRIRLYSKPMCCLVLTPALSRDVELPEYPETFTWSK